MDRSKALRRRGLALAFLLSGCAGKPPAEEYALARTAIEAARQNKAPTFAAPLWHRAEDYYRSGQERYRENDFRQAKEDFLKAKALAEKAETASRLKQVITGDR